MHCAGQSRRLFASALSILPNATIERKNDVTHSTGDMNNQNVSHLPEKPPCDAIEPQNRTIAIAQLRMAAVRPAEDAVPAAESPLFVALPRVTKAMPNARRYRGAISSMEFRHSLTCELSGRR